MSEMKRNGEQIYLEYKDKVMAYVRNRICSPEDAEDICSEIFLKVFKKLNSFDSSKASVSTWIYTIARNTLTDHFRTTHISEEITGEEPDYETAENIVIGREQLTELAEGLKKLPREQCDIIVLRYSEGYSLQKISEMMNLSYGATKLRHSAALKTLREYLGR